MLKHIKRRFMDSSLYIKIIILNILTILFPLILIILFSYMKISSISQKEFSKLSHDTVMQINNSISTYLSEMDTLAYMVANNSLLNESLSYPAKGYDLEKAEQRKKVLDFINSLVNIRTNYNSILVFGLNGETFYKGNSIPDYSYDFKNSSYIKLFKQSGKPRIIVSPHIKEYTLDRESYSFTIVRAIYNVNDGSLTGYILIDINYDFLDKLIGNEDFLQGNNLEIIEGDRIIYSWDRKELFKAIDRDLLKAVSSNMEIDELSTNKNGEYFFSSCTLESTNWKIILIHSMSSYNSKTTSILKYILIVSFFCVILSFFIASSISSVITRPLKKLKSLMEKAEEEDFNVHFDALYNDEISRLAKVFNLMIGKIKMLIKTVYKSQLIEKNAVIYALQSQINPHFLYNTLQSISDMAELGEVEKVSVMTMSLSSMFRYSIENKMIFVRFYDELEHIKNYIYLQSTRYGNKFKFIYNVPEELLNIRLPRFILQPLIENSIVHGIFPKIEDGIISIKALVNSGILQIIVEDNGIGINSEKLRDLNSVINSNILTDDSHETVYLGLNNVNKRLVLNYGSDFALKIESQPDKGTKIIMKVPVDGYKESGSRWEEGAINV